MFDLTSKNFRFARLRYRMPSRATGSSCSREKGILSEKDSSRGWVTVGEMHCFLSHTRRRFLPENACFPRSIRKTCNATSRPTSSRGSLHWNDSGVDSGVADGPEKIIEVRIGQTIQVLQFGRAFGLRMKPGNKAVGQDGIGIFTVEGFAEFAES